MVDSLLVASDPPKLRSLPYASGSFCLEIDQVRASLGEHRVAQPWLICHEMSSLRLCPIIVEIERVSGFRNTERDSVLVQRQATSWTLVGLVRREWGRPRCRAPPMPYSAEPSTLPPVIAPSVVRCLTKPRPAALVRDVVQLRGILGATGFMDYVRPDDRITNKCSFLD